ASRDGDAPSRAVSTHIPPGVALAVHRCPPETRSAPEPTSRRRPVPPLAPVHSPPFVSVCPPPCEPRPLALRVSLPFRVPSPLSLVPPPLSRVPPPQSGGLRMPPMLPGEPVRPASATPRGSIPSPRCPRTAPRPAPAPTAALVVPPPPC